MKKVISILTASLLLVCLFYSCSEDNGFDPNATGELEVSFKGPSTNKSKSSGPFAIILSIKDINDDDVYLNKKIELLNMNGEYITAPISLKVGKYFLTDFLVIDEGNNVIYASPKEGSAKAYLVNDPLDINIIISEDIVTKVSPEVISTENITPEDFGYGTFSFDVVETFNFLTAVFVYDEIAKNFALTESRILIKCDEDTLFDNNLGAQTNIVTLNSSYDTYDITIQKDGYNSFKYNFTKDSLKQHFSNPLIVILSNADFIILQPGPEDGKDAYLVRRIYNDGSNTNYGTHPGFISKAGTFNGEPTISRSLIDFDLSSIPSGVTIKSANLYLYGVDNVSNGKHSQLSGSNESYLQRVTSSWDEMTVTWNKQPPTTAIEQVYIPANDTDMQDYTIDVTSHIQDMINNPETDYGFMIKVLTEDNYRALIFGSSDNPIVSKRPKLLITYE